MKQKSTIKWRTWFGLALVALAVVMDWMWVWGLIFLMWVIPDLFTGRTYFMDEIAKDEQPFLYWLIVIVWTALSLYTLSAIFYEL